MVKHPQNNLKEILQDKLYNARVDAEDLSWFEFKAKLVSRKSILWRYTSLLGRVAAVILVGGLVSYFIITNSDSTSPEMITGTTEGAIEIQEEDESSGQETGGNYTFNVETKEDFSENEEDAAQSIISKTYPYEGVIESISQKELASQTVNEIKRVKTEFSNVSGIDPVFLSIDSEYLALIHAGNNFGRNGNGGNNLLTLTKATGSQNSFSGSENLMTNKDRILTFNKIIVGFKPHMQYNQIEPVKNDLVYLNKIHSNSVIHPARIGLNIYTAVEADLSRVFSVYSGVSYLFQHNNVQLEATSIISNDPRELKYDGTSHSFGLQAGLKAKLFEKDYISYSLVIENEYQKTVSRSEFIQPDRLIMSIGYELAYRYSSSTTLNFQPLFAYSFEESSGQTFTNRPYWIGLKFSLSKNIY